MSSSGPKSIYVHVQLRGSGADIDETVRIPFASIDEALPVLKERAASAASSAPVAALLRSSECALFLDDSNAATRIGTATLAAYPDGGDVFARVSGAAASATRTIYVHCGNITKRFDGFVEGRTTDEELLRWLVGQDGGAAAAGNTSSLRASIDGEVAGAVRLSGPARVSEDGDVFFVRATEGSAAAQPSPAQTTAVPATEPATTPEGIFAHAEARVKLGKCAEAITALRTIDGSKHTAENIAKAKTRIAELLANVRRFKDAETELRAAIRLQPKSVTQRALLGDVLHRAKNYDDAIEEFKGALSTMTQQRMTDEKLRTSITIRLGAAMYESGRRCNDPRLEDRGIDTVQRAVNGDLNNALGLLWMSRFYARKGLPVDALQVAARIIAIGWENPTANPDMKAYKKNFADILRDIGSETDSVEMLRQVFGSDSRGFSMEMWAMFATIARDNGLLRASLRIFEIAMLVAPQSSLLALNYAHGLENVGDHIGSVKSMRRYIERTGTMIGSVTPRMVLDVMADLPDADLYTPFPSHALEPLDKLMTKPRKCVRFTDELVTLFATAEEAAKVPIGISRDAPLLGEGSAVTDGMRQSAYTDEQLSLMAIYFTLVKNLYIIGALHVIPPLLALLNPLRVGQDLHRTVVRNEHAYFLTVAALMQYHDFAARGAAAESAQPVTGSGRAPEDVLYVCGDSHSLAPSWRVLNVDGKPTLLANAIVTGLKLWHLRPDCTFYPKCNFDAVVKNIPDGAQVMFLFGEIDCREGIIQAVDRGMYGSIDEALEVIADIYIAELLRLRPRFRRVFVHLPLPVITVTTRLVLSLCKLLAAKLAHHPELLVVYCHVVNDHDLTLKSEYELDTTHIAPTYVPLLEQAINGAIVTGRALELQRRLASNRAAAAAATKPSAK